MGESHPICAPVIWENTLLGKWSVLRQAERFALVVCGRDEIHSEDEEKLEARKMLENAADSHTSGAPMKMGIIILYQRNNTASIIRSA